MFAPGAGRRPRRHAPSWSPSPTSTRPGWPRTTGWLAELGAAPGADRTRAARLRRHAGRGAGRRGRWSPASTRTHDEYIVAALRRRLRRGHREADDHRRRRLPADPGRGAPSTGRRVTVAFNYRYNPLHEQVRELLAERRDRRDRLGALRVAARRAARRRLLPPLAPRQGQLRRPAGAQGRATTSTWSTGGSTRHRSTVYAPGPAVLLRRGRAPARLRPRLRPGARRPRGRRTTRSRCTWPTTRDCASSTSTPRTRTATSATRTSSRPG